MYVVLRKEVNTIDDKKVNQHEGAQNSFKVFIDSISATFVSIFGLCPLQFTRCCVFSAAESASYYCILRDRVDGALYLIPRGFVF